MVKSIGLMTDWIRLDDDWIRSFFGANMGPLGPSESRENIAGIDLPGLVNWDQKVV